MSALAADPQFHLFAICSVILSMQMLSLGFLTAKRRADNKGYLNPEDKVVAFKDAMLLEGIEHPDVARLIRAHRNLNESLPVFFALGLIFVLADTSMLGAQVCFITFTGARILHSIVYIRQLQPWRTMMFGVGSLALIGMMVQILMAVVT